MSIEDLSRKFYTRGVRLLSGREHSELELRKKLLRGGWFRSRFDDKKNRSSSTTRCVKNTPVITGLINEIVNQLKTDGFLSDTRYSESYIRMRINRGYGPIYITRSLREHGISDELIELGLNLDIESWINIAKETVRKQYRSSNARAISWEQKARFLTSRGFPTTVILRCLGNRRD